MEPCAVPECSLPGFLSSDIARTSDRGVPGRTTTATRGCPVSIVKRLGRARRDDGRREGGTRAD
jgi:hypothetical protein